jgi:hypothetical protein
MVHYIYIYQASLFEQSNNFDWVGGSLWVLRLPPPLVAMILLKVALNTKNQSINQLTVYSYKRQTIEYTIQVKGQVQQINITCGCESSALFL